MKTDNLTWIYSIEKSIHKQSSRAGVADRFETRAWEGTSRDRKIVMVGKKCRYRYRGILKYRHRPRSTVYPLKRALHLRPLDPLFFSVNSHSVTRSSAIAVIADRTACSILTLYSLWSQHLDLWIKKIPSLTVRGSNNYCSQSAHLCCIEWPLTCSVRHALSVSLLTNERAYSTRMPGSLTHLWRFSLFLWCILWLNDTSYSKSV